MPFSVAKTEKWHLLSSRTFADAKGDLIQRPWIWYHADVDVVLCQNTNPFAENTAGSSVTAGRFDDRWRSIYDLELVADALSSHTHHTSPWPPLAAAYGKIPPFNGVIFFL